MTDNEERAMMLATSLATSNSIERDIAVILRHDEYIRAQAKSQALKEYDVIAVCDGCHQRLTLNEIEPYGSGYCHVVPNGDSETGEMWPEPCGPVYIMRRSEVALPFPPLP